MKIRKNLVNERKNKDLTQEQLSKHLKITTRHYKALEAGTSYGSVQLWIKLKMLFNKSIDYLLEQADDDNSTT